MNSRRAALRDFAMASDGSMGAGNGGSDSRSAAKRVATISKRIEITLRMCWRLARSTRKVMIGAEVAAPMHQDALSRFAAAALRSGSESVIQRLIGVTLTPRPKPRQKMHALPVKGPLTPIVARPTAISSMPSAAARRQPSHIIKRLDRTVPITAPKNSAVKSWPAWASSSAQRSDSRGRIGPRVVLAAPCRTNPRCPIHSLFRNQ